MGEEPRIVVLYEDSGVPKRFGPHKLLCACVADELERNPWQVEHLIEAFLKKSNSNVREAVKKERDDLCARGRHVVAVLDDDEVRRLFDLEKSSCRRMVLDAFTAIHGASSLLHLVLLEENIESVLRSIAKNVRGVPKELCEKANDRKKPKPNDRDLICAKALGDEKREDRSLVREEVRSFDRLVLLCASLLPIATNP